jgi:uncharacterized protein (TIGR03118 family)
MRGWAIPLCLLAGTGLGVTPVIASPIEFAVTYLASDQPGVALSTDHDLVNAWGLASSSGSPFWIGANGTGKSVIYSGAGVKQGLIVSIPGDGSVTGVVFSNVAGSFNADLFLFASEDGTISGWRGALGTTAEVLQAASAFNVYKGLAQSTIAGNAYAYAANFHDGTIDVVKGSAGAPSLSGNFVDPGLPSGYAPFNVQNIGGTLYVTYAVQDGAKHDDVAGAGNGIVDAFDLNGNFLKRLVTGGALDSPWGLAMAPAGFGDVAGDLLVGNFGNGLIDAYNPSSGALVETLLDSAGNPIMIDGLWGLRFGNGAPGQSLTTLYFTAGPGGESHGLFGDLAPVAPVPEPGTCVLIGSGLLGAVLRRRRAATSLAKRRCEPTQ